MQLCLTPCDNSPIISVVRNVDWQGSRDMASLARRKDQKQKQAIRRSSSSAKEHFPKGSAKGVRPGKIPMLRIRLGLSQPVFARLLPASTRSIASLEAGAAPSEAIVRRLTELDRLTAALSEVVKKETLGSWLQTPNSAFDNLKPIEVIERGESDRIWSMIYFLRSGVPA